VVEHATPACHSMTPRTCKTTLVTDARWQTSLSAVSYQAHRRRGHLLTCWLITDGRRGAPLMVATAGGTSYRITFSGTSKANDELANNMNASSGRATTRWERTLWWRLYAVCVACPLRLLSRNDSLLSNLGKQRRSSRYIWRCFAYRCAAYTPGAAWRHSANVPRFGLTVATASSCLIHCAHPTPPWFAGRR